MNTRILRRGLIGLGLLLAGAIAAPAAFARTHVSIGLGFYGPGYSVGINDCINCYRGYYPAYYSGYYAPAYYYRPAPVYYAPAYYYRPAPVYYNPYPVYGTVYYGRSYGGYHGWHDHDHDHDGWRDDDDRYSHGGYYHH
jgi:hypothetical protein